MPEPWETIRLLGDPTRLRLVRLLSREELSVAEIQDILGMGQSRISSHLAQLRNNFLVTDRKDGKRSFYSLASDLPATTRQLLEASIIAADSSHGVADDDAGLTRVMERRRRASEDYFNSVAGRLTKNYCPGRSWEAMGHALLQLVPQIDVVDLGAGEGVLSQLLAQKARSVVSIDSAPKMVEFGSELAKRNGIENLEYRLGDIEEIPADNESFDVAILSQALHHAPHPKVALREAFRILRPGGLLLLLDLREHSFEKARELYADIWLGFSENQLYSWIKAPGFESVTTAIVAREPEEPHFETILATARKPRNKSNQVNI